MIQSLFAKTKRKTLVVNAAFLQEIKESNPDLWHAIHQLRQLSISAQSPSTHDEQRSMGNRFVRLMNLLREHLSLQFSLEESYGYLEVPWNPAQTASDETAVTTKQQHCAIYLQAIELAELAEDAQYRGAIGNELPKLIERFARLEQTLREHEQLEGTVIDSSFPDATDLTGNMPR